MNDDYGCENDEVRGSFVKCVEPKLKVGLSISSVVLTVCTILTLYVIANATLDHFFSSVINRPSSEVMNMGNTVEREGIEIKPVAVFVNGKDDNVVNIMLELRDVIGNRFYKRDQMHTLTFSNVGYTANIWQFLFSEEEEKISVGITVIFDDPIDADTSAYITINSILMDLALVVKPIDFQLDLYAKDKDVIPYDAWVLAALRASPDGPMGGKGINCINHDENGFPEFFLRLNEISEPLPGFNGIHISNIGFHNGMLHIQIKNTEAHGMFSGFLNNSLFLLNEKDNDIRHLFEIGRTGDNIELVFDVSQYENLQDMRLATEEAVASATISGPWIIDFMLSDLSLPESKSTTITVENSQYFEQIKIKVSPLYTTFRFVPYGSIDLEPDTFLNYIDDFDDPYLTLSDNSKVRLYRTLYGASQVLYRNFYFDISQLYSISFDGKEYSFLR